MAGAALVDPRMSLQRPGLPPVAAGTPKTVGPTKPGQVLDAPLLRPEPHRKLQKPSHPIPLHRSRYATLRRDGRQEHLENLSYPDREIVGFVFLMSIRRHIFWRYILQVVKLRLAKITHRKYIDAKRITSCRNPTVLHETLRRAAGTDLNESEISPKAVFKRWASLNRILFRIQEDVWVSETVRPAKNLKRCLRDGLPLTGSYSEFKKMFGFPRQSDQLRI